uniref:Teratocyte attacin II n=1 Tax=Cotesia flavipes TaxID=89805 RepID=A0A8K1YTR2_COTFL|nr:teratocyte attacin II [Cotesia flavipes]
MLSLLITLVLLCAGVHSQRNAASFTVNSDGSSVITSKLGIAHNDKNAISALISRSSTGALSKGLSLDNVNGNGLSVQHTSVPGFGTQLTGAGKLNLINNANHHLDANAFVTKNMPNIPEVKVPNFNTFGGNLDYMFKDKVGATLSAARTPFLERTDYSAMGKLNLFHSPTSSIDLNAGYSRSMSPHFNTNWQPSTSLTFNRFW